jgi:nucleotide-binding universal stress UspA family protein
MYKRILVPLDGSARAEAIMPHVEGLARCFGATLILLQVIEPAPVILDPQDLQAAAFVDEMSIREEEARKYLAARQAALQSAGVASETRLARGPVVQTINSLADSETVDLIAMASHGRTGLAQVFFGSVALGVLHHATRPLLLVRSDGPQQP